MHKAPTDDKAHVNFLKNVCNCFQVLSPPLAECEEGQGVATSLSARPEEAAASAPGTWGDRRLAAVQTATDHE